MTDRQASVGIHQLNKLDWIVGERRKIAARYHEAFSDIDCIRLLLEEEGYYCNYQSYSIYLLPGCPVSRNDLMQRLLDMGISSRRGIMTTHRETAYKEESKNVHLPDSEHAADNSIIIPLYIPMTEEEINKVIHYFREILTTK